MERFKNNLITFLFVVIVGGLVTSLGVNHGNKAIKIHYLEQEVIQLKQELIKYKPVLEPTITTINTSYFPAEEVKAITAAAKRNNLKGELYPILFAIRKAENGRDNLAFGIMNPEANTFDKQAGWCAATIQKNHDRWIDRGKPNDFITFLGNKYCPTKGATNDPNNLNRHWIGNVEKWVAKIQGY